MRKIPGLWKMIRRQMKSAADEKRINARSESGEVQSDAEGDVNAERIAACVHACEGIPTDSLHKVDVIKLLRALGQLEVGAEEGAIMIEDAVEAIDKATQILGQFGTE